MPKAVGHNFRIIAGLGNPGPEYKATYHNAGRLALDYLLRDAKPDFRAGRDKSFEYAKVGRSIYLRPLVFMNDSGRAVKAALNYFKLAPRELLVLQDDSDLPLGTWRLSSNRGDAGHHGVESLIAQLGRRDFARLRIGIRTREGAKAEEFVLRRLTPMAQKKLYGVFETIEKVIEKETA